MLLRIGLVEVARNALPLLMQGLALAAALLIVGVVGVRMRVNAGVPGGLLQAPNIKSLRWTEGANVKFPTPAQAALYQSADLDCATSFVLEGRFINDTSSAATHVVVFYPQELMPSLSLMWKAGREPSSDAPNGEVFLGTGFPVPVTGTVGFDATVRLDDRTVSVAGVVDGFVDLPQDNDFPSVWAPAEAAGRLGADLSTPPLSATVLLQPKKGCDWDQVLGGLEKFEATHPGQFPAWKHQLVDMRGQSEYIREKNRRGTLIASALAFVVLLLALAVQTTYFVGRQPVFTTLVGTLFSLGVPRRRLLGLCAVEPLLISIVGTGFGLWMISVAATDLPRTFGLLRWSDVIAVPLMAITVGLVVSLIRYRRIRQGLRGNLGEGKRLADRLYPALIFLQVSVAIPVLALAVLAGFQWWSTSRPTFPVDTDPTWLVDLSWKSLEQLKVAVFNAESVLHAHSVDGVQLAITDRPVFVDDPNRPEQPVYQGSVTARAAVVYTTKGLFDVVRHSDSQRLSDAMIRAHDHGRAVANESLARLFPDALAESRFVRLGIKGQDIPLDAPLSDALEGEADRAQPILYRSLSQFSGMRDLYLWVRASNADQAWLAGSAVASELDATASSIESLPHYVDRNDRGSRASSTMLAIAALASVSAAFAGIWSVLAALLSHAKTELALHFAMGRPRRTLWKLVVRKASSGLAAGFFVGCFVGLVLLSNLASSTTQELAVLLLPATGVLIFIVGSLCLLLVVAPSPRPTSPTGSAATDHG